MPLIERALVLGVNYIDTSARYEGPARWSGHYFGLVMKRRRAGAFLATKTHDPRDSLLVLPLNAVRQRIGAHDRGGHRPG